VELYKILYDSTDRWAEPVEQTADMRASLRFRHCVTAQHWWTWLETLYVVKQQPQRSAKHHKLLWAKSRRDYEVARANLEARAGQTERAQRLIFPSSGGGVVDNAYWDEVETTTADGTISKEWHFITDPEKVANRALEHVQGLFPQPLGWRPELRGATFPAGYAFEGCTVVSPRLTDILTAVDEVDLGAVLLPMTMPDLTALIRQQKANSAPGMSGITYGHLRAMSDMHRLVCLKLINRFISTPRTLRGQRNRKDA
jgi:hypothetical protein